MKAISYAKLFKILIDRKISKAELRKMCDWIEKKFINVIIP